ncbi:GNAT family N-acetyltransferase [Oceanobacillus jeddahense]|uniref:GNAT family N-acetyltransferase n=1 Tax=Oceanobacillus jeddahense TaxID=1462527 RepID=UPI000595D37D|nr:N-acetyltransferase [Oceanobacillus jeddahense]
MIRLASELDARAVMQVKHELMSSDKTSTFFITSPTDISEDLLEEEKKIQQSKQRGDLYIVAEAEKKVVGFLLFQRYGMPRLKHAGSMVMGISEQYCNQGIGTQLIEYLINWGEQQKNIEKICLGVLSVNERAIKVYKRIGFIEEGRQLNHIKYEDGTYSDDILMAYHLNDNLE